MDTYHEVYTEISQEMFLHDPRCVTRNTDLIYISKFYGMFFDVVCVYQNKNKNNLVLLKSIIYLLSISFSHNINSAS